MPPGLGLGLGLGRSLVGPSWWGYLEPSILCHLGAILEISRALSGDLRPSWGPLEAILEPSWAILGPSWVILGLLVAKIQSKSKNIDFPYGF